MTAEILYFPVSSEVRRARHVASLISKKTTQKAQQAYWGQVVGGIAQRLRIAQADDEEISRQIEAFHAAVSAELSRQARQPAK